MCFKKTTDEISVVFCWLSYSQPTFRSKNCRIDAWELTFEWEHLFRIFRTWFRLKHYLGGLEKRMKQKNRTKSITGRKYYSPRGHVRHENLLKWTLLLDNFSLRNQQMVLNNSLYPYKCPDFHLRKILPQFWANKHFASDAITQSANLTKLARGGTTAKTGRHAF